MIEISVNSFFALEEFAHKKLFDQVTYPWEALLKLKDYFAIFGLGKIEVEIPEGVTLVNPELISIGKGTIVEPGAYIAGPCIIGKNCQVRHGAYIRGGLVTGDNCVIGHATEIKESILLNGASAPHFNYVGESILGNNVNLGAGLICANYRLDGKNVAVHLKNQKISTSMKKLGAIIGDGSKLGCNCVLSPGTLLGKRVFCHPCLKISGYIVPNSIIKTSSQ